MFETVIQGIFSAAFLASILRVTTPILLPSLGALISDRAGVINIGLEGMMLFSAFTGVMFSAYAGVWFGQETGVWIGPWLGLLMGTLSAVLLSLILAFFHLNLRGDIILSALAINIFGSAATVAIMYELTGDRGTTSALASYEMPFIQLPEWLQSIPLIGTYFYDVFNNQSVMTWIAFIAVAIVGYVMYRTPFGMHLRAVGENPQAAASVGIPVKRVQYMALAISGMFAGLGGIHMSMGYLSFFQRDMTAGRGFIALSTPLLGGGTPLGTMLASLVFGLFESLAIRIGSLAIPPQLPQMIPYVATVMALVIYALQTQLMIRVRSLRAVEGENFDRRYWRAIQQLSVLHMFNMMIAIVGAMVAVSIIAAPTGFGGEEVAFRVASLIGIVCAVIIGINLPFILKVERIQHAVVRSWLSTTLTLTVYFGLFFVLFYSRGLAFMTGIGLGVFIWLVLGGWILLMPSQRKSVPVS